MKIPAGVLPFARDGGGSPVFLDLSSNGGGSVVGFIQGLPGWAGRRTESAFIKIASSFDEYVENLYLDRGDVVITPATLAEKLHPLLDFGIDWTRLKGGIDEKGWASSTLAQPSPKPRKEVPRKATPRRAKLVASKT